jgi:hypothetical protein
LRIPALALAGMIGLVTSGCESSILSSVPQVQAGPTPPRLPQIAPVSETQAPTLHAQDSSSTLLPLTGTRNFRVSDGMGTVGTMTIVADGTATLNIQEPKTAAVEYHGNFSNPVALDEHKAPLPEAHQVDQSASEERRVNGCTGEDASCEFPLRQIAHQASEVAAQDESLVDHDDRFIYQDFSPSFFQQVLEINRDCGLSIVAAPCSTRVYAFKDGNLTTKSTGTESTEEYTMNFQQPVTEEVAFSYLTILNDGKAVDLTSSASDQTSLQSCPDDTARTASYCKAELLFNADGAVSGVKLTHIKPKRNS